MASAPSENCSGEIYFSVSAPSSNDEGPKKKPARDFKLNLSAREISEFLAPGTRPDVQNPALDHVVGLTGTLEQDTLELFLDNPNILASILDLAAQGGRERTDRCLKALINLSAKPNMANFISRDGEFLEFCVRNVTRADCRSADGLCKLLCNLTRDEGACRNVLDSMKAAGVCVQEFVNVFTEEGFNADADYDHMALVLQNLSRIREIRVAILDESRCVVQRILPLVGRVRAVSERRRGVVGLLKNCCFETDRHDWLLGDDVDILAYLLLPLTGPEEFTDDEYDAMPIDLQYLPADKTREPISDIRLMLVEAVMKLCCTQKGRLFIKDKNTYLIMRELDNWETVPDVSTALERLISLLIGDEPEQGMEELQTVQIPDGVLHKLEGQEDEVKDAGAIV